MANLAEGLQAALAERYRIQREIGHGGMSVVYLAEDLKHHRQVAVKVLLPELTAALGPDRFLREIEIAARLQHPHILALHDSGEACGILYYVMPFVEGESLRERLLREGQLPVQDALGICREIGDALSYAHAHDVVHRDIKPENILLSGGHAVVADFGIARAVLAAREDKITPTGIAVGTPAYMSPEQATGSAPVDGRSDLYSLGCMLYEMLAGEPPFTGPTPQAVSARQLHEEPRSLRVVRPTIPLELEEAVATALAKVPADRYPTVGQFVAALRPPSGVRAPVARPLARRLGPKLAAAAVGLAGLSIVVWRLILAPPPSPDPQRIVVYPLAVVGQGENRAQLGENITLALKAALDHTAFLKGVDGWPLLDQAQRDAPRRLSERAARSVARKLGAGWYVNWSLLLADSARMSLALHDPVGDSSVLERVLVFDAAAGPWQMGLRAATELLPVLIRTGQPVDLGALSERSTVASAQFLFGDRAYRRANFSAAFEHYRAAVGADSGFALAALKAAQLASWNQRLGEARQLIGLALAHQQSLSPRHVHMIRGFEAYLSFRADSAVRHFRQALEMDSLWPEAWMALGEVYTHLLPGDSPLDSLAEAAFTRVHRLDADFLPVLYHLLEIALRKGEIRHADRLMHRFREGRPDSAELMPVELMFRCVRESAEAMDWRGSAHRYPDHVSDAARSLAVGGLRQADCAREAWSAILEVDTAGHRRWGALLGRQSVLVAQGRYDEARRLLEADRVLGAEPWRLFILDALAGAPFDAEAAQAAERIRSAYRSDPSLKSTSLWYLGSWEVHQGRADAARAISDTLAARAARNADRRDSLLARSLAARATLARGDSTRALGLLQALVPTTGRTLLTWEPWESLGAERLLLAQLRLARGEFREAFRVAANFDAPSPVPGLIFLPASLSVRLRAAQALGWRRAADQARARLAALGRRELLGDSP